MGKARPRDYHDTSQVMIMLERMPRWLGIVLIFSGACGGEDPEPELCGGEPCDYCESVAAWDASFEAFEDEVLELTNQVRAEGADCGEEGSFGPAPALAFDERLRCAARNHARDMQQRDFFDHENPDGEQPWDRMERAGYDWQAAGENIAVGQPAPEQVIADWLASDGHCRNLMLPEYEHLGVGYYFAADDDEWSHYWAQVFGRL